MTTDKEKETNVLVTQKENLNNAIKATGEIKPLIKKLRDLDISKMKKNEQKEYLSIVNRYEESRYISNERPKFKYMLECIDECDKETYTTLCKKSNIDDLIKIYDNILDLHKDVKNKRQQIKEGLLDDGLKLAITVSLGIGLVVASIVSATASVFTSGTTLPIFLPIISIGLSSFIGLGGVSLIWSIICGKFELNKMNQLDKNLTELENKLLYIRNNVSELKESLKTYDFDIEFKKYGDNHKRHINDIIEKFNELEKIINSCK